MKVLVTGGAGFIGSHTAVALADAGHTPVIIDDFSNSSRESLDGIEKIIGSKPLFYEGDFGDKDFLLSVLEKEPDIEAVIHFAAFKAVGESTEKPLAYYQNNVANLLTLLETLEEKEIRNVIFSSSATVYGEPDVNPLAETARRKPATNPYGTTKAMCEDVLYDVSQASALKVVSLRYFNPIGAHPAGHIGEVPQGTPANLVPYLMQVANGERDRLTIFGDDYTTPDGTGIRDYIHIMDLARAHVLALEKFPRMTDAFVVYNVGLGEGVSVYDLIATFENATSIKIPYTVAPRRKGDIDACWADATKITSDLDWQPQFTVRDALEHAWQFQQSQKNSS